MAQQPTSSALRALGLEFKGLQEEPVEGFRVKLVNEDNLFEWEVAIFGPPDTLYEGGYFKVNKAGTGRVFGGRGTSPRFGLGLCNALFKLLYLKLAMGWFSRLVGELRFTAATVTCV